MKEVGLQKVNILTLHRKLVSCAFLIFFSCFISTELHATARYAKASGNWSSTSTWSATSGGTVAASVPTSGDSVIIERNFTVTVDANASCLTLIVRAFTSNGTSQLTIDGFTVTVGTGGVQIVGGNTANRKAVLLFNSTSAVLTVDGNVSVGSGASGASTSTLNMTTGGTLNLTGTMSRNTSDGVFTPGAGTVNYNSSAAAQTISFTNLIYNNLSSNNTHSSGATIGAAVTATNVLGNINIGSGTFNSNSLAITLGNSKTFTLAAGATYNGGTSTITFGTSGTATINGTFNTSNTNGFSGAAAAAISSTNSPTINQGSSSSIGLAAANTSLSSGTYNSLSLTSGGTVTASGALTISNGFTMSSGTFVGGSFTHNISGNWNVSGGSFTSTGTTINFNGSSSQAISSTVAFNSVTINNSAGVTLSSAVTVNGTLTLTSGKITLGSNNLTIGTAGSTTGGSASSYIVASGSGTVVQQIAAAGSKSYPVGTASVYIPVTIALTGASTTDNFSVNVSGSVLSAGTSGSTVSTDAVGATWFISEASAGNSDATITLQWPASLELSGFNRAACRLAHYSGSWDYGPSDLSASGSGPYTVSRGGFTSFSPFSVGENIVLPVKWTFIKAEAGDKSNIISWGTASEYNADHFEVEYSENGIDFKQAGTVVSQGSNGGNYSFEHELNRNITVYYRIRQVDKDGKSEYSQLMIVKSKEIKISIYPNPAADHIRIANIAEGATVLIKDVQGRTLKSIQAAGKDLIDIHGLETGVYFICVEHAGTSETLRFVKD